MNEVDSLAKTLWNYHLMHLEPSKADIIIALGSKDGRVAERAAELYKQDLAPLILFSGGLGQLTSLEANALPEAVKFSQIAKTEGVPEEAMLIERESSNTGENIQFSHRLLNEKGIVAKKIILITKPYMERRAYATFMKQWPSNGVEIIVTSPQLSYEEYCSGDIPKDIIINLMVGDLQRVKEYPKRGFQIEQKIPNKVWEAYQRLVELGFDKQVMK